MEFIFWFCVLSIVWAYAGYPLSLIGLSKVLKKSFKKSVEHEPTLSIIIATANAEKNIVGKLDNTLAMDYPVSKVEYIVSLDGATDDTANVVRSYAKAHPEHQIIISENEKGGKESAQLEAVKLALGDILVFTDVDTSLRELTLRQIVSNFADGRVGAVDGMSKIDKEGSSEGLYLKYENIIRKYESVVGSLVTMGGCLFAVRREIVQSGWDVGSHIVQGFVADKQSDFRTALMTKTAGYQAVIDEKAIAYFKDLEDTSKEFNRKHRTVVRALANLFTHLYLLNPLKYGLFSYQLFNHKVMKWLVPFFMVGALLSNIVLMPNSIWYLVLMLCQLSFYAIAGDVKQTLRQQGEPSGIGKIIYFFVMSNLAILKAWFSYAKGERFVMWEPSKR